jgi:MFS transporter, putative metabolite:H+ symporter
MSEAPEASTPPIDRGPKYRRRLLQMLATATFFNGYDGFVLAFALPLILANLGGSEAQGGLVFLIVNAGEVVAFLLAAQADRIGRRRLLLTTIIGYTLATLATAASPNLAALTAAQFVARIFLGAEWAVAISIVVEDFPQRERGRGLAVVSAMLTLGGILVGVLAFVGLGTTALQWRAFYLVGIVPLIVVAMMRRGMHETERYTAVRAQRGAGRLNQTSLGEPWKPRYRRNLLAVGLMHFFRYTALSAAVAWWPTYAQREVGMSVSLSGIYLATAGVLGAVGFLVGGRLMDRWGRRPTFLLYEVLTGILAIVVFQTHSIVVMLPVLCMAIFFGLGSGCMTSAFATETFPTYVRSRAAAWARNAFEIPGALVGPTLVGILGDHRTGPIGSIGDAMTLLIGIATVPVLFIAWRYIQETKGLDLVAMDESTVLLEAGI